MTSNTIETVRVNATIDGDEDAGVDEAYLDVARVTIHSSDLLRAISNREEAPDDAVEALESIEERAEAADYDADADLDEYIDDLQMAFGHGRDVVLDVDDTEPLKQDFAAAIDEETLRDLEETVVPVGRHFGVDVTLPTVEEVRER